MEVTVSTRRSVWGRAALLAALIGLGGCDYSDAPQAAPLRMLAEQPADYDGELVTTAGTVRHFQDPLHYWIEDDDLNRVALKPVEKVKAHLGKRVRVTGVFHYQENAGREIELQSIREEP